MMRAARVEASYLFYFVLLLVSLDNVAMPKTIHDANWGLELRRSSTMSLYDTELTCRMQPNGYLCNTQMIYAFRYYYDIKWQGCKSFLYGKCRSHNLNYYNSMSECKAACENLHPIPQRVYKNLSLSVICTLQPEFGECQQYQPSWYFDVTSRTCKGFSYSGCGGNPNRFATAKDCNGVCGATVFADTVPIVLPNSN